MKLKLLLHIFKVKKMQVYTEHLRQRTDAHHKNVVLALIFIFFAVIACVII